MNFVWGLLVWTFAEYAAHRWLLHGCLEHHHRIHHIWLKKRIFLPLYISLSGAILLFLSPFSTLFITGFLTGYVYYEALHFTIHYLPLKVSWHDTHHKYKEKYFGVTSPFWDSVFRTI